jgi:hypothetical protein
MGDLKVYSSKLSMKGQRQAQRQCDFKDKTPMSFTLFYTLRTDYGNPNNMGNFRSCGSFIIIMYAGFSPQLVRANFCLPTSFIGLAYQDKDIIVFRFIIKYSSLRDFGP